MSKEESAHLVRTRGYEHRDVPFKLASGEMSHDYIDGKFAVDSGPRLRIVSEAVVELAQSKGINFTAVGGLTMGADPLAHGIAIVAGTAWFSVRKEPKGRGRNQRIEGARLTDGEAVLLVDDVVTTGGSIKDAYDCVVATRATVAGVIPMLDRGDNAAPLFEGLGVAYYPLVTYRDLGIIPVRGPRPVSVS